MKRFVFFLLTACLAFIIFGCSESPITAPQVNVPLSNDGNPLQLVQRPEFIDTRPASIIMNFTLVSDIADNVSSGANKRPEPPPDTGSSDPNPNPAHKYAYVVGISDYEGTANDLNYCDDDAMDMKAYYQSQGFTVRVDTDRGATADAIAAGLDWLIASAAPGDEIAFSYSGHGVKTSYGSCLISTDLYYVTHAYVMNKFNAANCSKKFVAIDACQAGSFLSDGTTGSYIATASTSSYSYDAPELHNGAWTYYFIEGTGLYTYAEQIVPYAEAGMKDWASIYHLRVTPSHSDKYTGMMDI